MMFRPVRWDYFYDPIGRALVSLVRKLIKLRQHLPQLRQGNHYFYNHYNQYQFRNILLYSRRIGNDFTLIALNFGPEDQTVPFAFPLGGNYREELHQLDDLRGVASGVEHWITVPSHYGRVWTLTRD
jgi:hypothetical protein